MVALALASALTVSHFRANPSFNVDGNSLTDRQNVKWIFDLFIKKVILQSKKERENGKKSVLRENSRSENQETRGVRREIGGFERIFTTFQRISATRSDKVLTMCRTLFKQPTHNTR